MWAQISAAAVGQWWTAISGVVIDWIIDISFKIFLLAEHQTKGICSRN